MLVLALVGLCARANGQQPPDARQLLEQLTTITVDSTQVYEIRNAQITRDRLKVFLDRGFIGLLSTAGGEVTGAVFSGEGEVLLIPPTLVEKQSLARFTGSPILEEHFTSAYLRFTDHTERELLSACRTPDPDESEQVSEFIAQWKPTVRTLNPKYSMRILEDLLGDRSLPYFQIRIQGTLLGALEVNVDERFEEAVSVVATRQSHDRVVADLWCSFPIRASQSREAALTQGAVRVRSYKIDTSINADNSLDGRAELELESVSAQDRALTFELSRELKVASVKDERGQAQVLFQHPSNEESEAAARSNDWIVVVLPSPHPPGEKFRLTFIYSGSVIADVGNRVLYVGARGSWYPNRGFNESASFDLTFLYPDKLTLVATGKRVEESASGGLKHGRWVSDGVFRVAGFNLGPYIETGNRFADTTVEVYAAKEAESSLETRHATGRVLDPLELPHLGGNRRADSLPDFTGPPHALSPAEHLQIVVDRAGRALEYFQTLFGPVPYPRLAISQVPGSFGQGWPELVYLPTLSFLAKSDRAEMGLDGKLSELLNDSVIAHEIAHQWWGNQLGWRTYHDQWLSEGVATYAAALYLAQEKDGERKFRDLLRSYKRDLLNKTPEGQAVESGGPIWLGQRLSNSVNPDGYHNIIYNKSCWVLHMLRGVLADPVSHSDEKFFKMLRDFVATQQGQNPGTDDFIRHAEKYMTRASDLEHNHRLDWFFNEWVYGSGIPIYEIHPNVRRISPQKFIVDGRIEQSGVSSDFEMLVPVTAQLGNKKVLLGQVAVSEIGGRFKFTTTSKPSKITIDEDNILATVR